MDTKKTIDLVAEAVLRASTVFAPGHVDRIKKYLIDEENPNSRWVLEQIIENARIAAAQRRPLCDDTGIPHLFLELGPDQQLSSETMLAIQAGLAKGLRQLPGRPMAVLGNDVQRVEQSAGLAEDPAAMVCAPIFIKMVPEQVLRLHILLQGGGPEIRGRTYRVFHKHSIEELLYEVLSWATEAASLLGCTPCVPAIGIGRSHYEASTLMLEAMAHADFSMQNDLEEKFTTRLNESGVGSLGLGGRATALASFIKIGPQRASGVRIVCLRLGCCVEPRHASVLL